MAESQDYFLRSVLQDLEALSIASHRRGHSLLASMIDLAKAEAEDCLRTEALLLKRFSDFKLAGPGEQQHGHDFRN
jgi:hypothetical protein